MDISISDILADVSRPSHHHSSSSAEATSTFPSSAESDLQLLTRAWTAERVAPEILPYPHSLMERVLARMHAQIERVEEQTGDMDPGRNFALIVVQTELERWKFMVRSFLRARIAKLDAHQLHYLRNAEYLSAAEQQYLSAHHSLLSRHYNSSFLAQMPPQLRSLEDDSASSGGGMSMVDEPDVEAAVFCRVIRDVGDVVVEGVEEPIGLYRGDIYVFQWRLVREYVRVGDVELI